MRSPDDSPRVAGHDVDAEAIDVPGRTLAMLADELGAEEIVEFVDGVPADGWRVLRKYSPDSAFLGAPVLSAEGVRWQTAYFNHAYLDQTHEEETPGPRPVIMMVSGLEPLEASRAERRRGLELRWPVNAAESGPMFSVEIVNAGDQPVHLSEKELSVVGVVTPPGTTSFSFGYASFQARGVPVTLAPRQSFRAPVQIARAEFAVIEPGSYELRAVLVDLGLQAPALPIQVPATVIAQEGAK